jgi:hypothetical protein
MGGGLSILSELHPKQAQGQGQGDPDPVSPFQFFLSCIWDKGVDYEAMYLRIALSILSELHHNRRHRPSVARRKTFNSF